MGSDVETQGNHVGRRQGSIGKESILHAVRPLRMIRALQNLNLYPISMDWISDRTRVLRYQNGYVKVLVERERINKLVNRLLYKYLKQKV